MSKIAFMFPGQGAQYTGMAKDFYDTFPVSRKVFEDASEHQAWHIRHFACEDRASESDRIHPDLHAHRRGSDFKSG